MIFLNIAALVTVTVVILFVVPRIIFPISSVPGTFLDRAVAAAVAMTALNAAAMYLLGVNNRLLELPALLLVWLATWWLLKGRHREKGAFVRAGKTLFDCFDKAEANRARDERTRTAPSPELDDVSCVPGGGPGGVLARARARVGEAWEARRAAPWTLVLDLAVVVVLAVAAWLRFRRAVSHVELVPQDSYLALSWTTFIDQGKLLEDGVYPQGTYMWMSLLDRFYPFSTYSFVRFAGPLMNVLELVVLYWAASRATRSRAAGLLALATFGFFAGNPSLLVIWDRQIGAMTQEFALAFGIVGVVFAANYLASHRTRDLVLSGCGLFMAATSNTLVLPYLAIAYGAVVVVGGLSGAWTRRTFGRFVAMGLVALVAGNAYLLMGWVRGMPLSPSLLAYEPGDASLLDLTPVAPGAALSSNLAYQLATAGAALAVVAGLAVAGGRRSRTGGAGTDPRRSRGTVLAAVAAGCLLTLVVHDLAFARLEPAFRTRHGWVAAALMVVGLGLGVGAIRLAAIAALRPSDAASDPQPRLRSRLALRLMFEALTAGLVVVVAAMLWPRYSAVARAPEPVGYPEATRASLEAQAREERLGFTFVGVSEQYQEVLARGFHTEAWVFARDIRFSDAADPGYELPIPTDVVYVFAERVPFPGSAPCPAGGPRQEYYGDSDRRERIMARISAWMEAYAASHHDTAVVLDTPHLRVYRIERRVDVVRADLSPAFKDYTWFPGRLFDDDSDVTAERVQPATHGAVPRCR